MDEDKILFKFKPRANLKFIWSLTIVGSIQS